jgi:hypothetical protein
MLYKQIQIGGPHSQTLPKNKRACDILVRETNQNIYSFTLSADADKSLFSALSLCL